MELLNSERSILVVIDLQGKLVDMVHRSELVLAATHRLMRLAELFEVPVVLTEQYPRGLGPTQPDLLARYEALQVPKRRIDKSSFGCCGDPGFERALAEVRPSVPTGRRQLVIAGIEAHVCVMQTVLEALRWGDQVHLCWEAVSGRGAEYRQWALERMRQAGAVVTNHESVGFEWARDKDHPRFKAFSNLLKEGQLGVD
ncbi:MAG: isochorismatase family protein [Acidobacteria bacterium]|nr:isochorismatase family protein [Acidobacteriota bacterium]